jgi:hypothetical protein
MRQALFVAARIAGAVAFASMLPQPATAGLAVTALKPVLATPGANNNMIRLVGHGGGGGGGGAGGGGGGAGGHGGGGGAHGGGVSAGRGGNGISGLSAGHASGGLGAGHHGGLNRGGLGISSYSGGSSFKVYSGGSFKGGNKSGMKSHVYATPRVRPSPSIAGASIHDTPSHQGGKKVTWDQSGSKWNGHHKMDHHRHVGNQRWYTPTLLYDHEFCYWPRRKAISQGSLYLRQRYRNCLY